MLLFLTSLAASLFTVTAKAYYGHDEGYGSASEIYASRWDQTDDELMRSQWVCRDIYDIFYDKGYWEYAGMIEDPYNPGQWIPTYRWHYIYGRLYNNFGDGTTMSRMLSEADHCRYNHDFAAVFHFGHAPGYFAGDGTLHRGVYPDAPQHQPQPPTGIYDKDIYPYTGSNHYFQFIWTCGSANKIGGFDSYGYASGLPFAWTHRANGSLSEDGYANGWSSGGDYCFLGFENYSKPLSEWINPENSYRHWLVFFYYYAVTGGRTVRNALDEASQQIGVEDFADEELELYTGYDYYDPRFPEVPNWPSRLCVYGEGDMMLP